jgi:hypothetical protein
MHKRLMIFAIALLGVAALAMVLFPGTGTLARGQGKGQGQGKGKPGTETTNNLSYPTYFKGTSLQTGTIGLYSLTGTLGNGMSYGCLKQETIGTTVYDNTSCVDDNGTYQTAEQCAAAATETAPAGKCNGFSVEPIYWQKSNSTWQAGYATSDTALPVDYIDWGDNLESKAWPVQVLRVETNTFSTRPPDEANPVVNTANLRYDMWHVFGQGTNELWGVHTNTAGTPYAYLGTVDVGGTPTTYAAWPYAVNVTYSARLNIAKLATGTASCTAADPYGLLPWKEAAGGTYYWEGAAYTNDMAYTPELNIKGSYVYGYNWNLRSESMPSGVTKTGWWRLTFYTTDNSINFGAWTSPTDTNNTLAPPVSPLTPSPVPAATSQIVPAADTGMVFVPQVDKANNLTYIDICITEGNAGGGQGGGKGNHGGR